MSDFLSPAILDVIKEKRMNFKEKLTIIFTENSATPMKGTNEAIKLFLDTIEKAKPAAMTVEKALGIGWVDNEPEAYNQATNDYERRLKKEIGK